MFIQITIGLLVLVLDTLTTGITTSITATDIHPPITAMAMETPIIVTNGDTLITIGATQDTTGHILATDTILAINIIIAEEDLPIQAITLETVTRLPETAITTETVIPTAETPIVETVITIETVAVIPETAIAV